MESLRSKVEEHLTCAICLEQFKDPKVLPCLHSYCHECIVKLDQTGNKITCPECRTTVEVRRKLKVFYLILFYLSGGSKNSWKGDAAINYEPKALPKKSGDIFSVLYNRTE